MSTQVKDPPAQAVAKDAHWSAKLQRLRDRQPMTAIVTFHDDEAAERVVEVGREVNAARRTARLALGKDMTPAEQKAISAETIEAHPGVQAALGKLEEAKAAQAAADVAIELRGLPADVYEDLVGEHPPTEAQRSTGETYNVHRFAPVLIATCCTDPMTPAEAASLIGGEYLEADGDWSDHVAASLTQGESSFLFQSAVQVNQNARVSVGKGSGPTQT